MTESARKDRIELALNAAAEMLRNCGVQLRPTDNLQNSAPASARARRRSRALVDARRVQLTIPQSEFHALEQAARRLGCSRANICRSAVSAFLTALADSADADHDRRDPPSPVDGHTRPPLDPAADIDESVQLSLF